MGWVPFDADGWPILADLMPDVWPPEAARFDLRWHYDQLGRIPSRRVLAKRWGWSDGKVRGLLRKPALWWDNQKGPVPELAAPRTQRAPSGTQRAPSGTQRAPKSDGANTATGAPAPSGTQRAPSGTQSAPTGNHTRVDPPSPSPSPSPPQEEHTSGQASPAKPGRPPEGDRAYRRWAFHECMKFWHEMRQEQGKRKRTLDPNGKANTEGGSLWRMVGTTRESLEPLIRVLSYIRWAEDDQPGGATYYRSKGLALVNIRRHLAELDLKAQDYHDANGGWKPRSMQSRRRETEAYEEPTPERLDEIRAYFAARAAQ